MQIQTKLFNAKDHDDYIFMIARGFLDARSVHQILTEVAMATTHQHNCKVLIDLIDTESDVDLGLLERLFHECGQELEPDDCKLALVSSLQNDQYNRLSAVSTFLAEHGLRIALFSDANGAIDWLFFFR